MSKIKITRSVKPIDRIEVYCESGVKDRLIVDPGITTDDSACFYVVSSGGEISGTVWMTPTDIRRFAGALIEMSRDGPA